MAGGTDGGVKPPHRVRLPARQADGDDRSLRKGFRNDGELTKTDLLEQDKAWKALSVAVFTYVILVVLTLAWIRLGNLTPLRRHDATPGELCLPHTVWRCCKVWF